MLASALVRPVLAVPVLAHPMIDLAVVVPVLLDLYSPFLVPDYTRAARRRLPTQS